MFVRLRKLAGSAAGKALVVLIILALWPIGILLCAFDALVWPFALLHDVMRDEEVPQ